MQDKDVPFIQGLTRHVHTAQACSLALKTLQDNSHHAFNSTAPDRQHTAKPEQSPVPAELRGKPSVAISYITNTTHGLPPFFTMHLQCTVQAGPPTSPSRWPPLIQQAATDSSAVSCPPSPFTSPPPPPVSAHWLAQPHRQATHPPPPLHPPASSCLSSLKSPAASLMRL